MKIRAILIDAYNKVVTEVEYEGLQEIYKLMRVQCIDAVRGLPHRDICYVDDEGLINNTTVGFYLSGRKLMGSGLVVNTDRDGNDTPPITRIGEIRAMVRFFP